MKKQMQRKSGSIVVTVVVLLILAGVATARALSNADTGASEAAVASVPATLSYQGHLLDDAGDPVADGTYSMSFSLWDDAATGTQVWGPEAQGSVQVTDGFFAVILGETSPIAASVLQTTTYLEIVVGGETLSPRQKLGAVAFALSASAAESVPWSGVTGKPSTFAPGTHTHAWSDVTGEPAYTTRWPAWSEVTSKPSTFAPSPHLHAWSDVTGEPAYTTRWPAWGEVTSKPSTFAPSSHTHGSDDIDAYADLSASGRLNNSNGSDLLTRSQADARFASIDDGTPAGVIVMWSGSTGSVPSGWALCDGSNGTPDLRDRFVVGAGGVYSVDAVGGSDVVTLTVAELPAHDHGGATATDGAHRHSLKIRTDSGLIDPGYIERHNTTNHSWMNDYTREDGAHSHTISSQGGGQGHENRPPYYALAYIMKLP